MKDKVWYMSKTVWAGIVIAVVGVLQGFDVPVQYVEMIYALAGAFGLYGLRVAVAENNGKK